MKIVHQKERAFSLVEVVLAMGVVSFCLLSVLALLPLGLSSSRDSMERTSAASIAAEISSDFRQSGITPGSGKTPRFQINLAPGTSVLYFGGDDSSINATSAGTAVTGNWLYRATVTVSSTPANSPNTIPLRILVTWPALSDANPAQPPANYTGSLDVSTAVNSLSP